LAGSSQVFTPLSTEHIHEGETDRYGPWHVPCNKAYMVFRSKTSAHHHLEWVEFRLTKETEEDRTQADSEQCTSEGVNHAQVEYGATNEEEEEADQGQHEEADRNGTQETETADDHTIKHSRLRRSFRIGRF
jgi:U3 small nucleolar RNA-associated protein 14